MILTIMRHGEAGMAASDRERQLTDRGRAEVAVGARRLGEICAAIELPAPDRVLFSIWERAARTAEIACTGLGQPPSLECEALRPGSTVTGVDSLLEAHIERAEHVLLVSHQPLVSQLVDHYLGERRRVPGLNPGGLVTLDLAAPAAGCGQLRFWALPPAYRSDT